MRNAVVTSVFYRNLAPGQVASATASGWTQAATGPNREGRTPANHPWLTRVREWHRRRNSRMVLAQLNDRALKDIGLTYAEAEWEANKYLRRHRPQRHQFQKVLHIYSGWLAHNSYSYRPHYSLSPKAHLPRPGPSMRPYEERDYADLT